MIDDSDGCEWKDARVRQHSCTIQVGDDVARHLLQRVEYAWCESGVSRVNALEEMQYECLPISQDEQLSH